MAWAAWYWIQSSLTIPLPTGIWKKQYPQNNDDIDLHQFLPVTLHSFGIYVWCRPHTKSSSTCNRCILTPLTKRNCVGASWCNNSVIYSCKMMTLTFINLIRWIWYINSVSCDQLPWVAMNEENWRLVTDWVWEITCWSSRLQENYQSF